MGTISISCVGFLESIGTTELMVILVVALIVFGPRKLPEMGRMLGRSLHEFKRASEDLQRTWEHAADTASPMRAEQTASAAAFPELERAACGIAEAEAAPARRTEAEEASVAT